MASELNAIKDLSTICATGSEVANVVFQLRQTARSASFRQELNDLVIDIADSYGVVFDNFSALSGFNTEQEFAECFAGLAAEYESRYLLEISKPRAFSELTFQKNLQFWKLKESKTRHPLLMGLFARLKAYIDKWIDNDLWLAMTIDSFFKSSFQIIKTTESLLEKDSELGYMYYCSSLRCYKPFLTIIADNKKLLRDEC